MDRPWISVAMMALYPIIVLAGANIGEVVLHDLITPMTVSLVIAIISYLILHRLFGNPSLAAMLVVSALIFFYVYGHVFYQFVTGIHLFEVTVGRHRFFYPFWVVLFVVVAILLVKNRSRLEKTVKFTNMLLLLLVLSAAFPVLAVIKDNLFTSQGGAEGDTLAAGAELSLAAAEGELPDIYYIILDGYAANQTLKELYEYDNGEFFQALKERGLFVADETFANHSFTYLSLTSSLNMMYVDWMGKEGSEKTLRQLGNKIGENRVAQHLKERGYRYITYDSGFSTTSRNMYADENINCALLNEFDRTLLRTTMLDPFFLYGGIRERILCQFDSIASIGQQGPDFVFAHIVAPHPPYVFDQNGGAVAMNTGLNPWSDKNAYVNQLRFINTKVIEMVDRLKARHQQPPIIIIQSDHGPASSGTEQMDNPSDQLLKERMRILNTYLVPESVKQRLYPSITPVNSFRLILNELFGLDYPLLEDKSFFTPIGQVKRTFEDVTAQVRYE